MRKIKLVIDKLKLYGLNSFKLFFLLLIRPFYQLESFIVLAIEHHEPGGRDNSVKQFNREDIENWRKKKLLSINEVNRLEKFIERGCSGFYVSENSQLAAWGFVQNLGVYNYGKEIYNVPNDIHILKNLFVLPDFRGKSYGKIINEARINFIPEGGIPVVFVIPENRFALRNLKLFGFEEYMVLKNIKWFKKYKKQRIKILTPGLTSEKILKGFQ